MCLRQILIQGILPCLSGYFHNLYRRIIHLDCCLSGCLRNILRQDRILKYPIGIHLSRQGDSILRSLLGMILSLSRSCRLILSCRIALCLQYCCCRILEQARMQRNQTCSLMVCISQSLLHNQGIHCMILSHFLRIIHLPQQSHRRILQALQARCMKKCHMSSCYRKRYLLHRSCQTMSS